MTPNEIIAAAQIKLHDSGNEIWDNDTLLDWVKDGVLQLLAAENSAMTFSAYDLPPRETWSCSYDWEMDLLRGRGRTRKFTFTRPDQREATQLWETADLNGSARSSNYGVTYLWELSFISGESDLVYKLILPRDTNRIKRLWYKNESIDPVSIRRLDSTLDRWWTLQGEPLLWSTQLGSEDEVVIFEIETTYGQAYDVQNGTRGIPRQISGDRTYTLDSASQLGIMRSIVSEDRQYFISHQWSKIGTPRHYSSDEEGILIWHSVVKEIDHLEAGRDIEILPPLLHKYVKYFVLSMAFGQRGEGYAPDLSNHYFDRFTRGLPLLNRLENSVSAATAYNRTPTPTGRRRRRPFPRLPSQFPQYKGRI